MLLFSTQDGRWVSLRGFHILNFILIYLLLFLYLRVNFETLKHTIFCRKTCHDQRNIWHVKEFTKIRKEKNEALCHKITYCHFEPQTTNWTHSNTHNMLLCVAMFRAFVIGCLLSLYWLPQHYSHHGYQWLREEETKDASLFRSFVRVWRLISKVSLSGRTHNEGDMETDCWGDYLDLRQRK